MSEAWCKCGAAQHGSACGCGILERRPASYEMPAMKPTVVGGDLGDAVAMLAADNARLCDIALAADALAEAAIEAMLATGYDKRLANDRLQRALDKYRQTKTGQ